jgi:hypothetical protein
VHHIEAPETGLQVGDGAAVVGGRDLAGQVGHQHHLAAGLACLRDQAIALAGEKHDLVLVGVKRQGTAQGHPAGAGRELGDYLRHPHSARHAVASLAVLALSNSRSGAPGGSPRVTSRHGSLALSVSAIS